MKKQFLTAVAYVLVSVLPCMAQNGTAGLPSEVEFYAVETDSSDTGKISLTQDLFYTQLLSFADITVTDKRKMPHQNAERDSNVIVFYAEIKESENEWICTLHMEIPAAQKKVSVSNTYDSYYKILTEAKASLQALFSELAAAVNAPDNAADRASENIPSPQGVPAPSVELISGNWGGEQNINKIVILRGGRGFVIFKNGASMNISVEIKNNQIICTQTGKSNASFFPDMPREIALVAALNADPIKWILSLTDSSTLSGKKETLQTHYEDGVPAGTEKAVIDVTWRRQQ